MQPKKKAVIRTVARSRTYSHLIAERNYVTRKKHSNTQTDCTIWKHTPFDQDIQFSTVSHSFTEDSRNTYVMALNFVNRLHQSMNQTLKEKFENNDSRSNEVPFIFPDIPDYFSLFSVILKYCEPPKSHLQSNYRKLLSDSEEHPTILEMEKSSKFNTIVSPSKSINADEDQFTVKNNLDTDVLNVIQEKEQPESWNEGCSSLSETDGVQSRNGSGQDNFLDHSKGHHLENILNNFLKLDKLKNFQKGNLVKTCFNIVNIQPQINLIEYARQKDKKNLNLKTIPTVKNYERDYLQRNDSNIPVPSRPNTPIKVKNMFDRISKSKEKIASHKIFENKIFQSQQDESDTDSVIFDDIEFEKMSQKCQYGTNIFDKAEESLKRSVYEKSNPLKLNGKDMTKVDEKMLSAIGLFTERGDIRPGVIDILEEHKKQKSKDTRNKQFRSKRQWDIQIHLKPTKEDHPSSLPSVSSDKSFISLSSDIRLQVKNVKSQFHQTGKNS